MVGNNISVTKKKTQTGWVRGPLGDPREKSEGGAVLSRRGGPYCAKIGPHDALGKVG